jgi:hypothetical protein
MSAVRNERVWVLIEEAGGAGLELGLDRARPGPVITGARSGGTFLGFDRGAVFEADTGDGSPLPAVVALPASAAAGCWVEAEVCNLLVDGSGRAVLVTALPGQALPVEPLIRVAARMPDGTLRGPQEARAEVRRANERFRRRRARGRSPMRPAWLPLDLDTRQVTGADIASAAERDLARLPPRFVRGLAGLLDPDERILASVERPPESGGGLLGWRRQRDRRAALLLLTDRQVLWLVDHVPPSRYLLDWGVDAELLPIERLHDLRLEFGPEARRERSGLLVRTDAGETAFPLPADVEPEARALGQVLERFLPREGAGAVRRRYAVEPVPFDPEPAQRFGQGDEAVGRVAALAATAASAPIAAFYAPRRERVRQSVAVLVTAREVLADVAAAGRGGREAAVVRIPLERLRLMSLALSPLVGRVELHAGGAPLRFTYPSPISESAMRFVRMLRRTWANAALAPAPDGSSRR